MCVKVADRQILHVGEKIVSKVHDRSLRDIDQQLVVHKGCSNAQGVEACNFADRLKQRCIICAVIVDHRRDVIIDQLLHEHRSLRVAHNAGNNSDDNQCVERTIFL